MTNTLHRLPPNQSQLAHNLRRFYHNGGTGRPVCLDAPPRRQLRSVSAISRLRQADPSWELEAISMTSGPLPVLGRTS